MFGITLAFVLPLVILATVQALPESRREPRLPWILLLGYALRLVASAYIQTLNIFSYGSGGDAGLYEYEADVIAKLWQYTGIHYMTGDEMPSLGAATLPPNLFGLIDFLNGEHTHLGCAAFVAALACATCIIVYLIALDIGVKRNAAAGVVLLVLFTPSFFFHTAHSFKDGFVAFFEFGILASALKLSKRFSLVTLGTSLACLIGLWPTRYYLVYPMLLPLLIGIVGFRSRSIVRMGVTGLVLALAVIASASYTSTTGSVSSAVSETFARGTDENVLNDNIRQGSGVAVDTSSPLASLGTKLVFALFAPFPWQSGSIALQLAKIESLLFYYCGYRAIRAIRQFWSTRRNDIVLFLSFIAPVMFVYIVSFSNIGLVFRERMGVVIAIELLSSMTWGQRATHDAESKPLDEGARAVQVQVPSQG